MLEEAGYTVLTASTANEAMLVIRANPNSISLLLTDVVLRGSQNGYELARQFRKARPDAKVLYMSGYSEALVSQSETQNGRLLLEKPFSLHALLTKVREAVDANRTNP